MINKEKKKNIKMYAVELYKFIYIGFFVEVGGEVFAYHFNALNLFVLYILCKLKNRLEIINKYGS